MHINLGPREIYSCPNSKALVVMDVTEFCSNDSPESVEKYKKYYQAGVEGEFLNGYYASRNILMRAAGLSNIHLVKYIAENADPKILNMRDHLGCSALHYAVKSSASTEKVIECTNARCKFRGDYSLNNLPPADVDLDEENFVGENPLGYLAGIVSNTKITLAPAEKEKLELLTELFITRGAAIGYVQGYYDNKPLAWAVTLDDAINENDTSSDKALAISELHKARQRVVEKGWPKTREFFLGISDRESSLQKLPIDLQKLVREKIME